jgi:hypothetical protein
MLSFLADENFDTTLFVFKMSDYQAWMTKAFWNSLQTKGE